jgi:hypothetical protein
VANASPLIFRCAALILLGMTAVCPARTASDCDAVAPALGPVTDARQVTDLGQKPPQNAAVKTKAIALRDWIAVDVDNLETLLKEAKCRGKPVTLYLNAQPMTGLTPSIGPVKDELYFQLVRTNDNNNRQAWAQILGSPTFDPRPVNVTVGIEGEPPLPVSDHVVSFQLTPVTTFPVITAAVCFLGLLVGFFILMRKTNVLRDTSPPEDAVAIVNGKFDPSKAVTNQGTYSLAKLQAAWWFFIIIGAYLLIGIVTWDFYSSTSSTALILLGIGAGTVVGGTMIDASKETPENVDSERKRAAELKVRITQLDAAQNYCLLHARKLDAMAPPFAGVRPLTPEEIIAYDKLKNTYGPNMVQWLRAVFGPTSTIVDIFELQSLNQADEVQAAASAAAGTARPAAGPQLTKLRAQYAGQPFADLCQLKAFADAGTHAPAALQNRFVELPSFSSLTRMTSEIAIEKSTAISRYRKLTNQSENWFVDILSDANGVSFHRFQLFSWTLILGGVFVVSAYGELNMPVFDTTLMGLLGLSAATYLGLKVPEPTIPPR